MNDTQLGRMIRELLAETGQGVYLPPTHGKKIKVAVMSELPGENSYYLVGETVGERSSGQEDSRAGKGTRTPDMLLGKEADNCQDES